MVQVRAKPVSESRDLDENTLIDLDEGGRICAITFEHASERTDLRTVEIEGLAA